MHPVLAGLTVFSTSAAVLVLEILAGRLLAPFVGESLETYTGIIGVVLAGIAVGSWQGGRLADRIAPHRLLAPQILLGGVLALLVVPIVTALGSALQGGGPAAILLLTTAGFFAPAAVLSAVTPTVIKIQLGDLEQTGSVVGRLSALSTAGAILGTFLTGFVLVGTFATSDLTLGVGLALLAGGAVAWWRLGPHGDRRLQGAVAVAVLAAALTGAANPVCDHESRYHCAQIVPDPEREHGYTLVLDALPHSYVDLEDDAHLEFDYMRMFGDVLSVAAPEGEPLDTLHLGGGALSLPRYLDETRPGSTSRVLEIDPMLADLAERQLGYEPTEAIEVVTADARLALEEQPDAAFDVVVGDTFAGLAVPWHLTTAEVAAEVSRMLAPEGLYTVNLIDRPPMDFLRAKAATLDAVFDHVAALGAPERFAEDEGGNVVLVASHAPLDLEGIAAAIDAREGEQVVLDEAATAELAAQGAVLRDDFAPVDQLLTPLAP